MNRATIIGYVGRAPELRFTDAGDAVCTFSVATSERWKDATGEQHERTEWHRVTCWRKQAEAVARYVHRGSHVAVTGKIRTREWQAKDGSRRWTTEIIAEQRGGVIFLDRRPPEQRAAVQDRSADSQHYDPPLPREIADSFAAEAEEIDDIPF